MEAPNPKHHIPNKYQSSKSETKAFWLFEIGIWSLFGICDLGFKFLFARVYALCGMKQEG
jgi:hypothetical protein